MIDINGLVGILNPGDIVVIQATETLSDQQMLTLIAQAKSALGDERKLAVLDRGLKMKIYKTPRFKPHKKSNRNT